MSEDGESGDHSFTVGPDGDQSYFSDEALRSDGIDPKSVNGTPKEMADIDRQFGDEPKGEKRSVFSRIFNRGRSNEAPSASPISPDNSEPDFIAELDRKQKEENARVEAITGNSEHFKDLQRLNRSFIPSAEKIYEEMKKNRPKGMENIDTDDVLEMRAAAQHQDLVARAEGKKKAPWVSREHQEYAERVKNSTQFEVAADKSVSPILPEFPGKERKVEGAPAPIPFQEIKGPANKWRPSGPRNDDFLPIEQSMPVTAPEATTPVVEKDKALPEGYRRIQATDNFPDRFSYVMDALEGTFDVRLEFAQNLENRNRLQIQVDDVDSEQKRRKVLEAVVVQNREPRSDYREFVKTIEGDWFYARRNYKGEIIENYKRYNPIDSLLKLIEPVEELVQESPQPSSTSRAKAA